jgi:hypothetical protein
MDEGDGVLKPNEYEVRVDVLIRGQVAFGSELRLSETRVVELNNIGDAASLLVALSRAIRETVPEGEK